MNAAIDHELDMVTARLPNLSHCHDCGQLNSVQWRKDPLKSGVKVFLMGFTLCECGCESVHHVEIIPER